MYTKFYDDTIVTRFIKYLLATTYVPLVRVWKPEDFAIKGFHYLYDGRIVKALNTGNLESIKDFDVMKLYIPNKSYFGINSTYVSNSNSYDSVTHRWLGNYLRFLRDYYNLNLMPFYNCFCSEFLNNIDFGKVTIDNSPYTGIISGVKNTNYKIAIVPVKFGTVYNLAVECDSPIEYMYGFYGPKGLIEDPTNTLIAYIKQNYYTKLPSSNFVSPIKVPAIEWEYMQEYTTQIAQYEKYLRLFIRIPTNVNTSITVIEGDISRYNTLHGISNEKAIEEFTSRTGMSTNMLNTCNTKDTNGISVPAVTMYFDKISDTDNRVDYTNRPANECLSPLGLLQWSDGYTYAFSNRLVEYLLLNVIDSQESISKNIERVQDRITSYQMSNKNLFPKYRGAFSSGVWDENIQKYIYSLRKSITKSPRGNPSVDYNGYVDKDTETILNRGNK